MYVCLFDMCILDQLIARNWQKWFNVFASVFLMLLWSKPDQSNLKGEGIYSAHISKVQPATPGSNLCSPELRKQNACLLYSYAVYNPGPGTSTAYTELGLPTAINIFKIIFQRHIHGPTWCGRSFIGRLFSWVAQSCAKLTSKTGHDRNLIICSELYRQSCYFKSESLLISRQQLMV